MISIRSYRTTDYDQVRALYENPKTFAGQFDEDRDSSERLEEQSAEDKESILVAESDGEIVGTISILQNKRFAFLMRFAASNEEVGEHLFIAASSVLKKRGHDQVLVYTPTHTKHFNERYVSLGFKEGSQDYSVYWRTLD